MREIFFTSHQKVSIEDAPSCFGPGQISVLLYPDCLSHKVRFRLEAQAQGLLHRLGSVADSSSIREIS
jgi:hypothetical protein